MRDSQPPPASLGAPCDLAAAKQASRAVRATASAAATWMRGRALGPFSYASASSWARSYSRTRAEAGPGLYRLEVSSGPRAGVRVLEQPTPPAFRESTKVGEQNLYTRAAELVGGRNPRKHESSIQMRSMDADKSGAGLGLPVLVALCGGLLGRNTRGATWSVAH